MKFRIHLDIDFLKNRKYYWILVIVITILAFALRFNNIGIPDYCDELNYVKLARFISYGHLASSTSGALYDIYVEHGAILIWGSEIEIVEPWFDHPPLFSILSIPFWMIGMPRLLPIFLGALSAFMIMYLLRAEEYKSILAGLIFSFFPFAVQLNAMMLLDNGSSFFFLLTISLTLKYEKDSADIFLLLAGISAGFSFLCKEFGAYSILYLLFYLLFTRKSLKDYKALILAIGIASSYFVVGLMLNKELFLDIISKLVNLAGTGSFKQNAYWGFLNTAIRDFSYNINEFKIGDVSPLLFVSWISLGAFFTSRKNKIIKIGILSLLITFIAIKYTWFQTWIAIYPFFSIALVHIIHKILAYLGVLKLVKRARECFL